jgi:dihydrolipoamide dehydrogenase
MKTRMLLLVTAIALIGAYFYFDLGEYLTLEYFKSQQAVIDQTVSNSPLTAGLLFFAVYVAVTALSLPGAALMTLAAGAVFGLSGGVILVSFASTIGATLAMLVSRFVFRGMVQTRFAAQLDTVNEGMEREGAFYLFTLRLVPVVPFFVINLVMGVTRISAAAFFLVSQIGMLAGTLVYVNAGTQIAEIDSLSGIVSPEIVFSFLLLGIFPLLAKRLVAYLRRDKRIARYPKPNQFDQDLVVIGAGSGGLVSAYIAAALKAKVMLIEKNKMGGDCLNTGCVPSKALIRSARFAADVQRSKTLGFDHAALQVNFSDVMERVQRVIKTVEPHDSVERYEVLGVNVVQGEATITSPYSVTVNGETITTRNIIIATGARPFVPAIPGLEQVGHLTSDTVWQLREQPKRLVVLGGGPIGTELSQSFARLGSQVTQIEQGSKIMSREDDEVSALVQKQLSAEGVDIRTDHRACRVMVEGNEKVVVAATGDHEVQIPFDQLLVALGRAPNTHGFGLEELGVELTGRGTIKVNDYLQTNYPNIYAVGDVAGPYQFTHTAAHQAWYATVNALFGTFKKFKVDYRVVPWSTFSSPEVARVGLNEQEALAENIPYEVTTYDIEDLDRAIADEEAHGLIKVLTVPGKDKILGVTIAGEHAGDLISEYVLAMKHGLGLGKIMSTMHIYPTMAEMNRYVAGEWRKNHKPDWLLNLVAKYHCWRRGEKNCLQQGMVAESL